MEKIYFLVDFLGGCTIDKRTSSYKYISARMRDMSDPECQKVVLKLGYPVEFLELRFWDIDMFHRFFEN